VNKKQNGAGVMEKWSDGVEQNWGIGVLEKWSYGKGELWNRDIETRTGDTNSLGFGTMRSTFTW
jgi:hypothetical protein